MRRRFLMLAGVFIAVTLLWSPAIASTPQIQLDSDPSGAQACLDGWWWDTTPITFTPLNVGYHTIQVSKQGYQTSYTTVDLGEYTDVESITLEPDAPSIGWLDIKSVPDSADVYVDGRPYGSAPMTIGSLWPGNHKLIVKKAGYYDLTDNIPITEGETFYYNAVLDPYLLQPQYGSLQIDSDPAGAAILLNGDYKTNTRSDGPVYLTELPVGSYDLQINLQDYQPYTEKVDVQANIVNDIHAKLVPIPPGPVPDATGQILASSAPSGAGVMIDSDYWGTTPLTIANIPAGNHKMTFTMGGYEDYVQEVNVIGGGVVTAAGTLKPVPKT